MMRAVLIAAAVLLAAPAAASADNRLTIISGEAVFKSDDAALANAYVVEDQGDRVHFFEPNDPKGIGTFPPNCEPRETSGTVVTGVVCPKSSITKSISVEAFSGEDTVRYSVAGIAGIAVGDAGADQLTSTAPSNDIFTGDQGNDVIDGGPGDDDLAGEDGSDTIKGGDGNDKLSDGSGVDTVDAGNGDDNVSSADGAKDTINCGPGNDTVLVDGLDELTECENVERRDVTATAGGDVSTADDKTRPVLRVGGLTSQRISRSRRTIRVLLTSSEPGEVAIGGYLAAAGVNSKIKPVQRAIAVGGGGVAIKLKLSARLVKLALRDLRKGRRPRVILSASATDAAGNTSRAQALRIKLRR